MHTTYQGIFWFTIQLIGLSYPNDRAISGHANGRGGKRVPAGDRLCFHSEAAISFGRGKHRKSHARPSPRVPGSPILARRKREASADLAGHQAARHRHTRSPDHHRHFRRGAVRPGLWRLGPLAAVSLARDPRTGDQLARRFAGRQPGAPPPRRTAPVPASSSTTRRTSCPRYSSSLASGHPPTCASTSLSSPCSATGWRP